MGFAVRLQLIAGLICLAIAAFFEEAVFWSVLVAVVIAVLPNAVFALYLTAAPKPAEYRFFVGEGIKIVLALVVATLFWQRYGMQVQPFAYWITLIVVLKAHNFGLLAR